MSNIRIPRPWEISEKLATPESVYWSRRQVLSALGLGTLGMAMPLAACTPGSGRGGAKAGAEGSETPSRGMTDPAIGSRFADQFPAARNAAYDLGGRPLTAEDVSARYNNFYEFTTTKDRVWKLAKDYQLPPWKIEVDGLVKKARTLDLDDLFGRFSLEERLYRFRCVERWAMQVPWTGFPLKDLIRFLEPMPSAKFVRFVTLLDKKGLPGQRKEPWYPWPYFEALRMDEAMHDLAFVVVGSYGHALPMQHGAPLRLAIPWKYGYKSPKSIVRIEFTKEQPGTFWYDLQPREYGFYSNVDPGKPHPRWSQAEETDIGTQEVRKTELYNGYQQVASLYDGKEF
ncbi:MAG: protein-methionine-sulfoxide reductase catalytic subunit MsrP [Acidobacteriota bacterium]